MRSFLLDLLACPFCKGKLNIDKADYLNGEIESGVLICSCGRQYSIYNGIPRFVGSDSYAESFSFQWRRFAKTQLDSFNKTHISANRFQEITGLNNEDLNDKIVLDAGCGMGRFLEIAAKAKTQVVGIDISFSVDAARSNLKDFSNVHLIQGNIFNPPLALNKFDFIYSIGVLHNTPAPQKAFLSITSLLSSKGTIAIWLSPKTRFPWLLTIAPIIRFFTSRMNPKVLLNFVRYLVPAFLPLVRVPLIGQLLKGRLIPICDYKGQLPLDKHQLLEWSILDTFNNLSPAYLYSYRPEEIMAWFVEAGFDDILIEKPAVTARAKRIAGG